MNCVVPRFQPLVRRARSRAVWSAGSARRERAGSRASAPRAPDPAELPRAASANVTDVPLQINTPHFMLLGCDILSSIKGTANGKFLDQKRHLLYNGSLNTRINCKNNISCQT